MCTRWLTVGSVVLALACGGAREAERDEGGGEGQTAGMPSMQMPSMDMLPAWRVYLDSLARADPAALAEIMVGHADSVTRMLAAMDQDMRAMNMTADSAWQGLADSVRADAAAIPSLSGEPLVLRMRANAGRLRRLLAMHEEMMRMMR